MQDVQHTVEASQQARHIHTLCVALCRQMVSRPVFADAFWKCYNTLKATATPEAGMPGYFRFLTLLSKSPD